MLAGPSHAQKFFPDDPLQKELPPVDIRDANYRAMSDVWDGLTNRFGKPGERHPDNGVIPSMGVNTLGEPLEGAWYVARHAKNRMTAEELTRGPGRGGPPSQDKPWQVLRVKRYDVRPGLLVADSQNQLYLIRFDPSNRPEMSTGATVVAANVYHALGYWVPENYIVEFRRSDLEASPEGKDINAVGEANKLVEEDIDLFLAPGERQQSRADTGWWRPRYQPESYSVRSPSSGHATTIQTTSSLTSTGANSARYPCSAHGWDRTGLDRLPRWTSWWKRTE